MLVVEIDRMNEILNICSESKLYIGFLTKGIMVCGNIQSSFASSGTSVEIGAEHIQVDACTILLPIINKQKCWAVAFKTEFHDIINILRYYATVTNCQHIYVEINLFYYDNKKSIYIDNKLFTPASGKFPSIKKYFKSALLEKCYQLPEFIADLILEFNDPDLPT